MWLSQLPSSASAGISPACVQCHGEDFELLKCSCWFPFLWLRAGLNNTVGGSFGIKYFRALWLFVVGNCVVVSRITRKLCSLQEIVFSVLCWTSLTMPWSSIPWLVNHGSIKEQGSSVHIGYSSTSSSMFNSLRYKTFECKVCKSGQSQSAVLVTTFQATSVTGLGSWSVHGFCCCHRQCLAKGEHVSVSSEIPPLLK